MASSFVPRSLCAACGLAALGFATLFAAGCNRTPAKPPPPPPADVTVQSVTHELVTDMEDFTGRLEAYRRVEVQSRVTGYLKKVNFTEGELVEKGAVLFEIDPEFYESKKEQAEATLKQMEAVVGQREGEIERARDLFRRRSISKEDLDKAVADHSVAAANAAGAKATLKEAAVNLAYTKVRAEFAGRVSRTMIDPGNLVKADTTVLTTLVTENPVFAYFDVDERTHLKLTRLEEEGPWLMRRAARLVPRQVPVSLELADEKGKDFPHKGTVDFRDTVIDPATGTKRMRGVFWNESPRLFTPGTFIRVRLQVGEPHEALIVSEQAVGTDQGQKFIYVVNKDNEVEYRKVTVGALNKTRRVVLDGVKEGERVIVSGVQKVRTKMKVNPIDEAVPTVRATAPEITTSEKK